MNDRKPLNERRQQGPATRLVRALFGLALVAFVAMPAAGAAAPPSRAQARPTPTPALPVLTVTGFSVAEGNTGTTVGTFTFGLSAPSPSPVNVDYATRDVTAVAASGDYRRATGRLTFQRRVTSATLDVVIQGDGTEEPDETFQLVLANPQGARLGTAIVVGEIVDDDGRAGPGAGATLSIDDGRSAEGDSGQRDATFTVTLSSAVREEVTVAYATADGSATAGEDYLAASGTLRFPAGTTSRTVRVHVLGDSAAEGDEDFTVTLDEPTRAVLAHATGVGLILDDDEEGAASLQPVGATARQAQVGQTVALQVRAESAGGEPVAGAAVRWVVDGAAELLDGDATRTDESGVATQRLRLGNSPGRIAVRALDARGNEAATFLVIVKASI